MFVSAERQRWITVNWHMSTEDVKKKKLNLCHKRLKCQMLKSFSLTVNFPIAYKVRWVKDSNNVNCSGERYRGSMVFKKLDVRIQK